MRIALRTSGGRGEYELTGAQGNVPASDIFGKNLHYRIRPDIVIDGHSAASRVQGKPRIRLDDPRGDRHAYQILTDVLLLPIPKRELSETAEGDGFVTRRGYAVAAIDVQVASRSSTKAELRPVTLWLTNVEGLVRRVDFAERLAGVQMVWNAARGTQGKLPKLVRDHEDAVVSADDNGIRTAAAAVRKEINKPGDPLPRAAKALSVDLGEAVPVGGTPADDVNDDAVDDETDPAEAVRREVVKMRLTASRGASGRRFSEAVRAAYDYRCAFCGGKYPKLDSATTCGVDGAHILPWAKYDLDAVTNGLCLCKLCHWAFDNGVLRVDYRAKAKQYVLSVPKGVKDEAKAEEFDLTRFDNLAGPIARWKLPASDALWPSPAYIAELNSELYS